MLISLASKEILIFVTINLISIFFLKKLSYYLGLIDYSQNKIHTHDTPKFGFQFFLIIIFFSFFVINFEFKKDNLIIFIYLFFFVFIGFLDDKFSISVIQRVILSLIITFIFFFLNPHEYYVSESFPFYLNFILLIFFSLGFIHLINMTDGINGLVLSLFTYSLFYYLLKSDNSIDHYLMVIIELSLLGSLIYLIPNFLGMCFLGNVGSYLIAVLISIIYMELYQNTLVEYSDIILIFLIPLIDALRVTVSRIINNKNPFIGDFTHIHHLIRFSNKYKIFYFTIVFLPSIFNFFFSDFSYLLGALFILIYFYFFYLVKRANMVASGGLEPPRE